LPRNSSTGSARRDLLLAAGGFCLFALVSFALLTALNPAPASPSLPLTSATPRSGERPIEITLIHTNDTWGYLHACG